MGSQQLARRRSTPRLFPSVCEATLCAGQPVTRTMVKWGGREGLRKGGKGDGEAERMLALC